MPRWTCVISYYTRSAVLHFSTHIFNSMSTKIVMSQQERRIKRYKQTFILKVCAFFTRCVCVLFLQKTTLLSVGSSSQFFRQAVCFTNGLNCRKQLVMKTLITETLTCQVNAHAKQPSSATLIFNFAIVRKQPKEIRRKKAAIGISNRLKAHLQSSEHGFCAIFHLATGEIQVIGKVQAFAQCILLVRTQKT